MLDAKRKEGAGRLGRTEVEVGGARPRDATHARAERRRAAEGATDVNLKEICHTT